MGLGRNFTDDDNLERWFHRASALPMNAPVDGLGLTREDLLDLISDLRLTRSKLGLAEQQVHEMRQRLEIAGLFHR